MHRLPDIVYTVLVVCFLILLILFSALAYQNVLLQKVMYKDMDYAQEQITLNNKLVADNVTQRRENHLLRKELDEYKKGGYNERKHTNIKF